MIDEITWSKRKTEKDRDTDRQVARPTNGQTAQQKQKIGEFSLEMFKKSFNRFTLCWETCNNSKNLSQNRDPSEH